MLTTILFTGIFKLLFMLGTVVKACNPSIQEVKEGGAGVQAIMSLGHMSPCFKTNNSNKINQILINMYNIPDSNNLKVYLTYGFKVHHGRKAKHGLSPWYW